jgi:4-hydroxythreonine-4-phosphate dehydrogenase
MGNPLPKLYHEKREDVEKIRFAIPKPKDQFKREDRKQQETQEQQKPE